MQFKKALAQLHSAYDFCIIDNPPALNVAVANSLVASNKIIICSFAEAFALDGLMEFFAILDDVHLAQIALVMNTRVYNSVIRRYNTISVSQSDRKSIFDSPTTNALLTTVSSLINF